MADVEEERHLKPFADFLALQRGGKLATELAERFSEVNRAVQDTGKPGSLSVIFKIKPTGDEVSVMVTDDVKATVPEHDRGQSIFFVDADGNPHRSQQSLDDQEHPVHQARLTGLPRAGAADPVNRDTGEVL